MSEEMKSRSEFASQGITLNSLKEKRRSLNVRLLWAMRWNDEDERGRIQKELDMVQRDIDHMTSYVSSD